MEYLEETLDTVILTELCLQKLTTAYIKPLLRRSGTDQTTTRATIQKPRCKIHIYTDFLYYSSKIYTATD